MKAKNVYKAEVWGIRLDNGMPTTSVKMVTAQFTNKDYMHNWSRDQINKPDIKPFRVYFYIKRGEDWELMTKVYVKVPAVKTKRRMLIWK